MRALTGPTRTTIALAGTGGTGLDNNRHTCHWLECLSQAYHPRAYLVSRAKIHEQDVISRVMNDAIKKSDEFRVPLAAHLALEYGELQPLTITVHYTEHPPPALRVADVIGHHEQMFFTHRFTAS